MQHGQVELLFSFKLTLHQDLLNDVFYVMIHRGYLQMLQSKKVLSLSDFEGLESVVGLKCISTWFIL